MMHRSKSIILFIITILVVVSGSFISVTIWSDKDEEVARSTEIIITPGMTITELLLKNNIPGPVAKKVIAQNKDLQPDKPVTLYTTDLNKLEKQLSQAMALYNEHKTKNWFKIPLKFVLWIIFMGIVFFMLKTKNLPPSKRKLFYISGTIIFGIILGADPSPMGTIKDTVVLYGEQQVIFKPRMIALGIFLFMVFAANKMICSWGCQFGILQDIIFRFNRDRNDTKGIIKQYKPPFFITNTIRILFFTAFTASALLFMYDIISPVDPFKIFKPQHLILPGIIMLAILLISSLFIYRPWCHLFCPFGLAGWLVEKISINNIVVDYNTCTECLACEKACPSTVMSAILRNKTIIPDCFSCGTCLHACKFNAISFSHKKRSRPVSGSLAGK